MVRPDQINSRGSNAQGFATKPHCEAGASDVD